MPDESNPPDLQLPAVHISCQLGKLTSKTKGVAVDAQEADRNSNRWVFDVEHDTHKLQSYAVSLVDFNTAKPKLGAYLSVRFTPIDRAAAKALLRTPDPDGFRIEVDDIDAVIHYRVTVDATIYATGKRPR